MWGIVGRIIIVFFICSILISGVQARYYDDSDHQDICSPDDGHIAHEAAMLTIDALNTSTSSSMLAYVQTLLYSLKKAMTPIAIIISSGNHFIARS